MCDAAQCNHVLRRAIGAAPRTGSWSGQTPRRHGAAMGPSIATRRTQQAMLGITVARIAIPLCGLLLGVLLTMQLPAAALPVFADIAPRETDLWTSGPQRSRPPTSAPRSSPAAWWARRTFFSATASSLERRVFGNRGCGPTPAQRACAHRDWVRRGLSALSARPATATRGGVQPVAPVARQTRLHPPNARPWMAGPERHSRDGCLPQHPPHITTLPNSRSP
jgi:hypothetical protein